MVKLNMELAHDKSCCVGSSQRAVDQVKANLEYLAGKPTRATRRLGVGYAAGGELHTKQARTTGIKRTAVGKLRAAALKRKLSLDNERKGGVYVAGPLPAETYGDEVTGRLPKDLQSLRLRAGWVTGRLCRGRPLDLAWACVPRRDPLKVAALPLGTYAKEWWRATSANASDRRTALKPAMLVSAHQAASQRIDPSARWSDQCTGPISIMLLWARKLDG